MFSIQKKGHTEYSLFIHNNLYRNEFYKFFIQNNFLPFGFINNLTNELVFHAEKVCLLKDCIKDCIKDYNKNESYCLHMIQSLSYQIKYFEKKGLTFLGFNIQDILVINDTQFFIAETSFVRPIHSSFIHLLVPYEKPYFSSPEIINATCLPSKIHYKSCYYSLGTLVVFVILNEYLLKANEVLTLEMIKSKLKPIYLSKMYWFLLRCLTEKVENRIILFV